MCSSVSTLCSSWVRAGLLYVMVILSIKGDKSRLSNEHVIAYTLLCYPSICSLVFLSYVAWAWSSSSYLNNSLSFLSHPDDVMLWVYWSQLSVLILCIVSVNASRCLASIGLWPRVLGGVTELSELPVLCYIPQNDRLLMSACRVECREVILYF